MEELARADRPALQRLGRVRDEPDRHAARAADVRRALSTSPAHGSSPRAGHVARTPFLVAPGEQSASKALFPGTGNGLKQRLRYIFADPGSQPIDVGLYGELVENEREFEVEAKLLLQRRFDRLRIAANLSGELELYFSGQRELVLDPSLGATYEIAPSVHVGVDSWLRGEYPRNPRPSRRTFGLGPQAYVGPALMFNFGKLWWAIAGYVRVSEFSHKLQLGEPYGPLYIRSLIGYDL